MSVESGDFQRVARFLRKVRSRVLWVHAGAGLACALAAAAFVTLLGLLAAAATGPHALWPPVLGVCIAIATLAALLARVARPLLGTWREKDVARFVGRSAPALRSDLLSTVELAGEVEHEDAPFSRTLALALAERTWQQTQALPLDRIAPLSPLVQGLGLIAATALAFGACALFARAQLERGALALSRRAALVAVRADEPIVGEVKLTLTYPPYTGLAPKVLPDTSGDVRALQGTTVRVETRALIPTRRASCLFADSEARPVALAGDALSFTFKVDQPTQYRFVLEPPAARPLSEPIAHKVEVDLDEPPRIEALVPADELDVSGRRVVEVGYRAEDDYGLSEIALLYRIDGAREQRRVLRGPVGARSVQGRFDWDLGALGLHPGARVAYRIEARDNDTVGGPHSTSSRTFQLRWASREERRAARVERQGELLDRFVAALGDRLTLRASLRAQRGGPGALLDAATAVHAREEEAAGLAAEVAEGAKGDPALPRSLRSALLGMVDRLGRLLRDETKVLSDVRAEQQRSALRNEASGRLSGESARHVPELERDVLVLDDLIGRQRLEDLNALAREASQLRDKLKKLLEQYRASHDPKLRAELERQMRELAARIREMSRKVAELHMRQDVPDEFLNARVGKDALSSLDRLASEIEKGNLDAAAQALNDLSSTLDSLQAALDKDLKGFRDSRFAAEEKATSEMLDKVGDLEAQERELQAETERMMKSQRDDANRLAQDTLQKLTKRTLEKVTELEKRAGAVREAPLAPPDQEEVQRARRRVRDLKKMIESRDLEQALEMAHGARSSLQMAHDGARDEAARLSPDRRIREDVLDAQSKLDAALPLAEEIVEDLERAMPSREERMSSPDRKRMQALQSKQQGIRQRTEKLIEEAQRKGKEAPGIAEAANPLRDAKNTMQRAEGTLHGGHPREAFASEEQARQQLEDVRKSIEKQRQPGRGEGGMRDFHTERVKIPSADEYRAPKEFRQDILDAMKDAERAPRPYRGQVKKYYEELVQ